MLISNPKERAQKIEAKRRLVLRFLRDETWTTSKVLGTVAGLGTRQATHKTLVKMERDKLVKRHVLPVVDSTVVTIWGITPHGLALSWDEHETYENRPYFEPSRLTLSIIPHRLDLQKVRLALEKANWTDWVRGERLGFTPQKRPDAIATRPDGLRVAIEVELTIKTRKRYQMIIRDHLMQIRNGGWQAVLYLANYAPRLQKIFDSIDYVPLLGERLTLKETHKKKFRVLALGSLEDWLGEGKN